MTLKYADRVLETSTTQGTSDINLEGPVSGFQSFVGGVGDAAVVGYFIEDGTDWEAGIGTVTAGSPDSLSRDVVLESSNSDALVNWGPGTRNVFIGASSHLMVWRDENGNDVNAVGTSGGTANAHTVTMAPPPRALSDKMIVRWRAPDDNAGNVTVNVNGLGAKSYVNNDFSEFPAGFVKDGTIQEAVYNLADDRFERTTQIVDEALLESALQPEDVVSVSAAGAFGGAFLHAAYQVSGTASGGTATSGAWRQATLNTSVSNGISGASVTGGNVELTAGTYHVEFDCAFYDCNEFQSRLYDTTNSAVIALGTKNYAAETNNVCGLSVGSGRFTLAGTATVQLQYQVETTKSTSGLGYGASNWGDIIYRNLKIWKVG